MGQKSRDGLENWFSQSSIRLQSRCCPEVQTFETRQARGCAPKTVLLQVLKVSAVCWLETLFLYHVNLSMSLIKCPHDMTGDPRDTKVVPERVFYDLVLVTLVTTLVIFTYSVGVPGQPCLMCKGTPKDVNIIENHGRQCWRLSQMLATM